MEIKKTLRKRQTIKIVEKERKTESERRKAEGKEKKREVCKTTARVKVCEILNSSCHFGSPAPIHQSGPKKDGTVIHEVASDGVRIAVIRPIALREDS